MRIELELADFLEVLLLWTDLKLFILRLCTFKHAVSNIKFWIFSLQISRLSYITSKSTQSQNLQPDDHRQTTIFKVVCHQHHLQPSPLLKTPTTPSKTLLNSLPISSSQNLLNSETCVNCQSPKSFPNKLFPFEPFSLMTQGLWMGIFKLWQRVTRHKRF
jgi:hypothetical protein